MKITQLFGNQLMNVETCKTSASMFLETFDRVIHQKSSNYFLLYMIAKDSKGEKKTERKDIFYGKKNYYLISTLQKMEKERLLSIFPTYYTFANQFRAIHKVVFGPQPRYVEQVIDWLVQQKEVQVRIDIEHIDGLLFYRQMETLYKMTISQKREGNFFKNVVSEQQEYSMQRFVSSIIEENKEFAEVSVIFEVVAMDKKSLQRVVKRCMRQLRMFKANVDTLLFRQREGIESMYLQRTKRLQAKDRLYIDCQSIPKIVKVAQVGLQDVGGYVLGKDTFGNQVMLDFFKRTVDRVNGNFIISGQTGQGKSTLLQSIINQSSGKRIYVVDPEGEYDFSAVPQDAYTTSYVGKNTLILNAFFEDNGNRINIFFIRQHFTQIIRASFTLQETFASILYRFSESIPEHTFHSLCEYVIEHASEPEILNYISYIKHLNLVTLSINRDINHFVFRESIEKSTSETSRCIFELLSLIWQMINDGDDREHLLLIDEAYILFLYENQIVMELLRDLFKRIRKYNGIIGIVTQNISDLMHPNMRFYLMTIFDNSMYKFLFYQGEEDLSTLQQLLKLQPEMCEKMRLLKRGECFLFVGPHFGKLEVNRFA